MKTSGKAVLALSFGLVLALGQIMLTAQQAPAPQPVVQTGPVRITMPLGRTAYQTNESIDITVVRAAKAALPKGELTLTLTAQDGSASKFTFPVKDAPLVGDTASSTEHLHLNGYLLRPGHYTVEVAADGAVAKSEIDVFSHVRQSTFRIGQWLCRANAAEIETIGEQGIGLNLSYGSYPPDNRGLVNMDFSVRGGIDFMQCCAMSGSHQMDMRMECDWSDPYVLGGGTARAMRVAFFCRTAPNAIGVHMYDEPGLTWHKHPKTGELVPHNLPSQERAYMGAFTTENIQYCDVKPDDSASAARWRQYAMWKLGFMESTWKLSTFGVNYMDPDWLPLTQTVYGWSAYADGYYTNINRCVPVISGHGGYDDGPAGYYFPGFTNEMGRARNIDKPNWYLPTWYGSISAEAMRLEQYLSFMTNINGLLVSPETPIHAPTKTPSMIGITESNRSLLRLGTIFDTMATTRPPIAVLYSMQQNIDAQMRSEKLGDNYEGGGHRGKLYWVYLASKVAHFNLDPIVDEDVMDGTLAANHKAVILTGINYLPPEEIKALEDFAAAGGTVFTTEDVKVQIKNAVSIGQIPTELDKQIGAIWADKALEGGAKLAKSGQLTSPGNYVKAAYPLAQSLAAALTKAGFTPVAGCDQPNIVLHKQAGGDIEYTFAANATFDPEGGHRNSLKPIEATISLDNDGRKVYDAMLGGDITATFAPADKQVAGKFRFGPGQMRVFARTAKPIAAVQVLTPSVHKDLTRPVDPIRLDISAVLLAEGGTVLAGTAPMQVKVIDPLGETRYDLFRASGGGMLKLSLPLAANDPEGTWTVQVRDLLSNKVGTGTFAYADARQCGALAGATHRAVYFGDDREKLYRFFRLHHDVAIVIGSSPYNKAAAERLAKALDPWSVKATIVNAADVNKARAITPEAARTWVGLVPGNVNAAAPAIVHTGFAIDKPCILMGTPEDNPIIKFLMDTGYLPYKAAAGEFPGNGRGYMSWQTDGVGYFNQESVTLIGYDEAGINEAAGSLYEAAHGLDPLTRFALPTSSQIAPVAKATAPKEPTVAWEAMVGDHVLGVKAADGKLTVVTWDGNVWGISTKGEAKVERAIPSVKATIEDAKAMATPINAELAAKVKAPAIVKATVQAGDLTAIAYWGGLVKVVDAQGAVKFQTHMKADIGGIAVLDGQVIVGLSDGRVVALSLK